MSTYAVIHLYNSTKGICANIGIYVYIFRY